MERKKTTILKGTGAAPGIAHGEARVIYSWQQSIEERAIDSARVPDEIARLDLAIEATVIELQKFRKSAGQKIGGPVAKIFDSQLMIASDVEFLKTVKNEIETSLKSAEYIYSMMVEKALMPLRLSRDEYMRQMVFDIEAVSNRVLRYLTGQTNDDIPAASRDCIFVARNFTPAEVLDLYERKARAIIIAGGSINSHMVLVARSLILPTVIGVSQAHLKIRSGDRLIVDGDSGDIKVNPTDTDWIAIREKAGRLRDLPLSRLRKLPMFPLTTADGVPVSVAANINLPGPLDQIISKHNIGVGLYRTEFMYLQHGGYPPEENQFAVYKTVADQYYPQKVVIRTFDLGSDKFVTGGDYEAENNPALGWRGIRATLEKPRYFREQIRAILRASVRKNVKILLPMITDLPELRRALSQIRRARAELESKNIPFDKNIDIGAMIEVPSAAIAADTMADRVDFFSIGSNDLTQYTLAADRDNQKLIRVFNSLHLSVLRLLKSTVDAAERHHIPVTVCGEMSGDVLSIPLLLGMGIRGLSMNPSRLHNAARIIPKLDSAAARDLAGEILGMKTLREIENRLFEFNLTLE